MYYNDRAFGGRETAVFAAEREVAMYLIDYLWFMGAILLCMLFSGIATHKVYSAYSRYGGVSARSGLTGRDTAERLMAAGGVRDVLIGRVKGTLSDHYDPTRKIVNLSDSVYSSSSVAAVAVAAHEIGHVMQKKNGYFLYRVRTALVPIVNFGSYLAFPLVLIGLVIDISLYTLGANVGFYIALVGVALYGGSFLFALVTLPVELNASRRAGKMLVDEGILSYDEKEGATKVLSAAALTYLASLLTSLVYFLRFFVYVITIFGRRNDR